MIWPMIVPSVLLSKRPYYSIEMKSLRLPGARTVIREAMLDGMVEKVISRADDQCAAYRVDSGMRTLLKIQGTPGHRDVLMIPFI